MKDNLKVSTYSNVNFIDINRTSIRGKIKFGKNVKIDINSIFEGHNIIGNNVEIKVGCIIKNSKIGNNTVVKPFTSIEDTIIGTNCSIGPYANLRNKNIIKNNVEVKKSNIGNRTRINHLSFIGDANISDDVTIGAGTITCNHDGKHHHVTTIKKGVYVGSGCKLIAPIILEENSTIGSGSIITENAPKNQLTISRSSQKTVKNWKRKK